MSKVHNPYNAIRLGGDPIERCEVIIEHLTDYKKRSGKDKEQSLRSALYNYKMLGELLKELK